METKEAKTWGGARAGSGRKKKYAKTIFFSVTQEVLDILSKVEENRSDFINRCILSATQEEERNREAR